jgi:hypothetical protein
MTASDQLDHMTCDPQAERKWELFYKNWLACLDRQNLKQLSWKNTAGLETLDDEDIYVREELESDQ